MRNLPRFRGVASATPHYGELTISLLARRNRSGLHLLAAPELLIFGGGSND